MASRSRGRPAAIFVAIRVGRSRHRHLRPNSSTSKECGNSGWYPPAPVISPKRSMSPADVVSVKFKPADKVSTSNLKGSPGGAPRKYGWSGPKVLRISGINYIHVLRETGGAMQCCGYAAYENEMNFRLAQRFNQRAILGHDSLVSLASRPARRSSSAKRVSSWSWFRRSSGFRVRFRSSNVRSTSRRYRSITASTPFSIG